MRLAPVAIPDWRDASGYEALLHADRTCFAWEGLRRDSAYHAAALGYRPPGQPSRLEDSAGAWGLHAFECPDPDFHKARPVRASPSYDRVIVADAHGTSDAATAFDLGRLAHLATLVGDPQGREHVLLSDRLHVVRRDVRQGPVADGPVSVGFASAVVKPRDCTNGFAKCVSGSRDSPGTFWEFQFSQAGLWKLTRRLALRYCCQMPDPCLPHALPSLIFASASERLKCPVSQPFSGSVI